MAKELFPNLDDFFVTPQGVIGGGPRTSDEDLKQYLESHKFSDDLEIPADDDVLFCNDLEIGSRGNILAINGRAKSRKSVIASAIMSSAFSDGFLGFTTRFKTPPKVLHFDTEQGFSDWLRGCKRVIKDAGLDKQPEGYLAHHSRDCSVEMRIDLLKYALELYRPDILIIDGVVDLVYDLNSQEEATRIGGELMTWSVKYNCLIVAVIHITKGNGYMTGALGTYLEKKCQTAIKCELDEDEPDRISRISCGYARGKSFAPFGIQYNDQAERYELTDATQEIHKSTPPVKASEEAKRRLINQVFNLCGAHQNEHALKGTIGKAAGMLGLAKEMTPKDCKAWVEYWKENQEIGPDPEGRIVRRERLVAIEKAMPRLDLNGPPTPRDTDIKQGDNNQDDDMPF